MRTYVEPAKRVEWFNALKEDDLQYLAAYHYLCLTLKFSWESKKPQSIEALGRMGDRVGDTE